MFQISSLHTDKLSFSGRLVHCRMYGIFVLTWFLTVTVTDFKYLGYRISEYKSDLGDEFKKYNKINGATRRHFGKQMNKETELKIQNINAKAALKFRSEAWVLKKREEQRLEATQMKFLRHLLGITNLRVDKEKNQCIRQKTGAQNIVKEIKQYQKKHVQRWTQSTKTSTTI